MAIKVDENKSREYLKSIGFNDNEIETLFSKTCTRGVDKIKLNIDFFLNYLRCSMEELVKLIQVYPGFIGVNVEGGTKTSFQTKIKFYKDLFKIDDEEMSNMLLKHPYLLGYAIENTDTSIKKKLEFYKNYGLNEQEIIENFRHNPRLFTLDVRSDSPTSIAKKIKFFKETFKLTDKQVEDLLRKNMQVITMMNTEGDGVLSIKNRIKFYSDRLGLSNDDLIDLFKRIPPLLNLNSEKELDIFQNKMTFYRRIIRLDDEYLKGLIRKSPRMFKEIEDITNEQNDVRFLEMNKKQIFQMIRKRPDLIDFEEINVSSTSIIAKLRFYKGLFDIESNQDIIKLVDKYPKLLRLEVQGNYKDSVNTILDFYKKHLMINDIGVRKLIKTYPDLLAADLDSNSPISITNRLEFWKKWFCLNDRQLASIIKQNIGLIRDNFEVDALKILEEKANYFREVFKLSDNEMARLVISRGAISLSINTIKNKIEEYKKFFNLDDEGTINLLRKNWGLLSCSVNTESPTSIKGKVKFYSTYLEIDEDVTKRIILKFPQLLGLDINNNADTSVKNKIDFYLDLLQISKKELVKLLIISPKMLGMDIDNSPTSARTKVEKMKEFLPQEKVVEIIKNNPLILDVPAQKFKIRFMLAYALGLDECAIRSGSIITSEKVIWARACYYRENNKPIKPMIYFDTKKNFEKRHKTTTEVLLERYPLNEESVIAIEKLYEDKAGYSVKLNEEELEALKERE